MIIRVEKTKGFSSMHNSGAENKSLSLQAKGLLWYLLTKPEDWRISRDQLATTSTNGVASVRAALTELQKAGYLKRDCHRDEKGLFQWECVVSDLPFNVNDPVVDYPPMDYPPMDYRPAVDQPFSRLNTEVLNTELLKSDTEGAEGASQTKGSTVKTLDSYRPDDYSDPLRQRRASRKTEDYLTPASANATGSELFPPMTAADLAATRPGRSRNAVFTAEYAAQVKADELHATELAYAYTLAKTGDRATTPSASFLSRNKPHFAELHSMGATAEQVLTATENLLKTREPQYVTPKVLAENWAELKPRQRKDDYELVTPYVRPTPYVPHLLENQDNAN